MIETGRLTLLPWHERHRAELRAHCADPETMRYLIPIEDDAAFEAFLARLDGWREQDGFTFWVVERRTDGAALGVCGLKRGSPATPIAGQVEIGWRFGRAHWRQGYAGEAAQAVLDWAWAHTDAEAVVAITVPANAPSWRLMERLGMTRVADGDFDHPGVADASPLKRHMLYRLARPTSPL